MRRSISKFSYPSFISFSSTTSPFSTSAAGGGGGGGGRGRGGPGPIPPKFQFTKEEQRDPTPSSDENASLAGFGHGRGRGGDKPLPPFTSAATTVLGRGRGRGIGGVDFVQNSEETHIPSSIMSVLSGGAGRGKAPGPRPNTSPVADEPKEENRHIRARRPPSPPPPGRTTTEEYGPATTPPAAPAQPLLSREEAVKKAVGILSRGGGGELDDGQRDLVARRGGRGAEGGGFRGRGRGGRFQAWRGRGGGRDDRKPKDDDSDDHYATGLYLGDDADGEKLSKRLGPDVMDQLAESFEEMAGTVLPSLEDDALEDAMDINYKIECEPEYLMGDFETNPDIDEKPPIPLRDALEKVKPFMMAYEAIQSQQEWEEVVEDAMKRVPLLKEIVDYYSGPDRVTAKQQQEELERVAKALPQSSPASVKRFTDRTVLSLQSNPGWGFDKKCQLMDKLVSELSQHYK